MKLPKSIIKRYGITKKAWSVFRGHSHRSTYRGDEMARRRHYRRSSGFGGFSMKKLIIGGIAGLIGAKLLGDSMIVRGGAGYLVGGGLMGAVGGIALPMVLSGVSGQSGSGFFYG